MNKEHRNETAYLQLATRNFRFHSPKGEPIIPINDLNIPDSSKTIIRRRKTKLVSSPS